MAHILKGDVVWADLNPTKGHEQTRQRLVLILSNDVFNDRSGTVIAWRLPVRNKKRGFPSPIHCR